MTLKQLTAKLKKLERDMINKELTTAIGTQVVKDVTERTQRGFGVESTKAPQTKLKAIKPVTKKIRKDLKRKGRLSSKTTPEKSNLTRTGKMLRNIGFNASEKSVDIRPKGSEQIKARKVSEKRPFLNLSTKEFRNVTKLIKEKIINDIKKIGL